MDAHCHLSDDAFDSEREEIYRELIQNNIRGLVLAGTEPKDWRKQIALNIPSEMRIARVFGMHPWWVDDYKDEDLDEALKELSSLINQCEGLGEMGLDYYRAKSPEQRARQRHWFEKQLGIAKDSPLPLVLHIVKAHHEALPILRKQKRTFRGLIHSFWANADTAKAYIEMGFLLSVPPRILKEDPHNILSGLDPEHIVFETDTPFRNAQQECVRPLFIHDMLEFVANVRGEAIEVTVGRQERLLSELFPVLRSPA